VHVCLPPHISEYAEEKRRGQNLIVYSGKSEAEVTIGYYCARRIVLLKLTAVRYEASRDLSATAELHLYVYPVGRFIKAFFIIIIIIIIKFV